MSDVEILKLRSKVINGVIQKHLDMIAELDPNSPFYDLRHECQQMQVAVAQKNLKKINKELARLEGVKS
jgi:hypothetical protein